MGFNEILIALLKKSAHKKKVIITTTELGEETGMSQQNASRLLLELEKKGFVERDGNGITIRKPGIAELSRIYAELEGAFHEGRIIIQGEIVQGLGEGRYYL